MKTILVPSDLGPMTDMALSIAVSLARQYKSEIILLHSVVNSINMVAFPEAIPVMADRMLTIHDNLDESAHDVLQAFADKWTYTGVTITPVLITSGQGLVDAITSRPADLIVIASSGASGLTEWLIGSNAEIIVRHAHCPVLVVKHAITHFRPETIVCAVDIDDRLKSVHHYPFQMGERGLHQFLYVMTPTDNRDPAGIREWVNEFAAAKGITDFEFMIRSAPTVPEGIDAYANEVQADLIVLFTHGHTGLHHLLSGSVAEDVLNHANVPVLVMRA